MSSSRMSSSRNPHTELLYSIPQETQNWYNENWDKTVEDIEKSKTPYCTNWDSLSKPPVEDKSYPRSTEKGGWDNPKHYANGRPDEAIMRAEEGRPYYEYIVQSHLASDSDYDNISIHQYRPRRNNHKQNSRVNIWGVPVQKKPPSRSQQLLISPVKTKGPAPDVPLWAPPPDDPVSAWLNRSSTSSRNEQVDKVVTGGNTLDDFINAFQVPLADERPAQPLPGAVGQPMTSSAGTSTRTSSSSSRSLTPSFQASVPVGRVREDGDPDLKFDWEIEPDDTLGDSCLKGAQDVLLIDDQIVIADAGNSRVLFFGIEGNSFSIMDQKKCATLKSPTGLVLTRNDGQYLGVADSNRVHFIDHEKNKYVDYFGFEQGTIIRNVCLTNTSDMVVIDTTNKPAIYLFNTKGKMKCKFKVPKLPFKDPQYIVTNPNGTQIYISDAENDAIFLFNSKGKYICTFGNKDGIESLRSPRGVVVNSLGEVFVVDQGNNKVRKYSEDGTYLCSLVADQEFSDIVGIATSDTHFVLSTMTMDGEDAKCSVKVYELQKYA